MPQLNRRYPSGAAKRRKKGRKNKADEKCNVLLDRFGTSEPAEESTASSTQVVNSSYNCLVQGFPTCDTCTPRGIFPYLKGYI